MDTVKDYSEPLLTWLKACRELSGKMYYKGLILLLNLRTRLTQH